MIKTLREKIRDSKYKDNVFMRPVFPKGTNKRESRTVSRVRPWRGKEIEITENSY